ncbi:MAG TPA: hypothetical protein VIC57_09610 [Candidatus Dormibacteraeota bacterium]
MASTTGDVRGTYGNPADTMPMVQDGWLLFSALMVLFAGLWNAFEGVLAFFRSTYFIGSAVFGSLWIWAILWVVFGVVQIAAAGAIMSGRSWGRWFGIVTVGLAAFINLAAIGTYPWWSVLMVAIDVIILYGLTVRWNQAQTSTV